MERLNAVPRDISILVVDDIPSARKVVMRHLKGMGFSNVSEIGQGAEALTMIDQKEIALVITDLHLKDMLGVDLIQKTREAGTNNELPFIVITSDMSRDAFTDVMQRGASTYLLKPFSKERLAEKIIEVLIPDDPGF